jgi:GNAT superfamily N-acetyltransferase
MSNLRVVCTDGEPFPPNLDLIEIQSGVEALFARKRGRVVGMFAFEPATGIFEICVLPSWRRCGIGTKLLAEAVKRWAIDFEQQEYTPAGAELVQSFLRKSSIAAAYSDCT